VKKNYENDQNQDDSDQDDGPLVPIAAFQGGRRLVGQAYYPYRNVWDRPEHPLDEPPISPPVNITKAQLTAIALELGIPPADFVCEDRPANDVEAIYLQLSPIIRFAVAVNLKGGGAYSILWTDLKILFDQNQDLNEHELINERNRRLTAYTKAINAAKHNALINAIGEPASLVFLGKDLQGDPFTILIDGKTVGPIYHTTPRLIVADPTVGIIKQKTGTHRQIIKLGIASLIYFNSMVLLGTSGNQFDPVNI
jgi:hypothetical protein